MAALSARATSYWPRTGIPGAADRGAAALTASLDQAVALTGGRPEVLLVVVGWSLGGTAALSLALDPGLAARVSAVVGLAANPRGPSPVDGSEPLARVRQGLDHGPPPIHLVHGRRDTVVPAADARTSTVACRGVGIRSSLALVDTDHAGIVGTRYDSALRRCVPDDARAATIGMDATLEAVRLRRGR